MPFETLALPVSRFLMAFATVSSVKTAKEKFSFPNFGFIILELYWGSNEVPKSFARFSFLIIFAK